VSTANRSDASSNKREVELGRDARPEYVYGDGIHLTPPGQDGTADLVRARVAGSAPRASTQSGSGDNRDVWWTAAVAVAGVLAVCGAVLVRRRAGSRAP
jgi:hypothetical protein